MAPEAAKTGFFRRPWPLALKTLLVVTLFGLLCGGPSLLFYGTISRFQVFFHPIPKRVLLNGETVDDSGGSLSLPLWQEHRLEVRFDDGRTRRVIFRPKWNDDNSAVFEITPDGVIDSDSGIEYRELR